MRLARNLSFFLAIGLALGACGEKTQAPVADEFPRDTLIIAYSADVQSLISVVPQSGADMEVLAAITQMPLLPAFDCGLEYRPLIAQSWSFSEDGKTLAMTLSDDFTWTDGTPVTAHDVAFTYELIADAAVASPRRDFIEHMVEGAAPRVIDDTHLEFEFTQAYDQPTMLAHATGVELLPRHALGKADRSALRGDAFHDAPVTNGPFRLESRDPGQTITLAPNEAWSGPEAMKPKLRRVILKILPEYSTQLLELQAGTVDMITALEVGDADRLARDHPEIAIRRRGFRAMEYVGYNQIDPVRYQEISAAAGDDLPDPATAGPHPLLGDVRVRRALTQAIDIDRMMREQFASEASGEVYAKRAVGTISPSLCAAHADDVALLPHDLDAARALMAEAGWTDSDGDGVLDRGGRKFSISLLNSSGKPRREAIAVTVQAALKELGVEVAIETVEFNTYVDRAIRKDFDALVGGWSMDFFVDPTGKWHSGPGHTYNFVSYADADADALIAEGLSTADPAAAAEIWRRFQRTVYEDQPYTFLWWTDELVGVHGRFQDVQVDLLSAFGDLWQWWVPVDQVKYTR